MPLTAPRPRILISAAAAAAAVAVAAAVAGTTFAADWPGKAEQAGVTITFLANEGVMLSSGSDKVLIDALFEKYKTGYAVPADSTRAALRRAAAPFDSVDLILVTHHHGDHFHPAPVVAHMLANGNATLLASAQVIDSLRGRLPAGHHLAPRLLARTTAPGVRRPAIVNGISVQVLGISHGRRHRHVEQLGFIVELGGRRVLHVGDMDMAEADFARFRLDTMRIDVALIPQWLVRGEDSRRMIERWIRPAQVVAFHVGDDDVQRAPAAVSRAMPGAITFTRPLESLRR